MGMTIPRKIEPGCFAIIRVTGEPVTVRRCFPGYRGEPDTFATSLGEFRSGELRRISREQFETFDLELLQ